MIPERNAPHADAHAGQCAFLDLPDALACHAIVQSDVLKRLRRCFSEPESALDNETIARLTLVEQPVETGCERFEKGDIIHGVDIGRVLLAEQRFAGTRDLRRLDTVRGQQSRCQPPDETGHFPDRCPADIGSPSEACEEFVEREGDSAEALHSQIGCRKAVFEPDRQKLAFDCLGE